jgi:hypothetical protein
VESKKTHFYQSVSPTITLLKEDAGCQKHVSYDPSYHKRHVLAMHVSLSKKNVRLCTATTVHCRQLVIVSAAVTASAALLLTNNYSRSSCQLQKAVPTDIAKVMFSWKFEIARYNINLEREEKVGLS